ncbi:hypothetical protein C7271_01730 [filamentous cyanobacterium CCP5]|nr:hypothetical protein C7271_01730 [filamentous cyanobacterium CCP5]
MRPINCFLLLVGILSFANAGLVLAKADGGVRISQNRPEPPPRLPPNRTRPGGGLDPAKQSCESDSQALTALVPRENPVLSVSEHPTFLFYIPDTSEDIEAVEFSLLTADEKERLYHAQISLSHSSPGIFSVTLPESPEYALEENGTYRWYLKVFCQGNFTTKADLTVDGWVERVAMTPERIAQIEAASPEIWYDSLAQVADHLDSESSSYSWRDKWLQLLRFSNLEELSEARIIEDWEVSNISVPE